MKIRDILIERQLDIVLYHHEHVMDEDGNIVSSSGEHTATDEDDENIDARAENDNIEVVKNEDEEERNVFVHDRFITFHGTDL